MSFIFSESKQTQNFRFLAKIGLMIEQYLKCFKYFTTYRLIFISDINFRFHEDDMIRLYVQ